MSCQIRGKRRTPKFSFLRNFVAAAARYLQSAPSRSSLELGTNSAREDARPTRRPLLSILSHGRNDQYMGNFKWRLARSLNRFAESIAALGLEEEVELLIVDWGSREPLRDVILLSDTARSLVKFLQVPQEVAARFNRDSPYSFVHASNCGIRRASGEFIMYCDADTYLPQSSLEKICGALRISRQHFGSRGRSPHREEEGGGFEAGESLGGNPEDHFFLASRYHIPISFHNHCATSDQIDAYIAEKKETLDHDRINKEDFMGTATAYLMHRSLWRGCRGFDEGLIYWGWFDIDLFHRLRRHYQVCDLEDAGVDFFHLEHYSNSKKRDQTVENPQRANPAKWPDRFAVNDEQWGLGEYDLPVENPGLPNRASATVRAHSQLVPASLPAS